MGENSVAVSCFLICAILFNSVHCRGRQILLFGSQRLLFYGAASWTKVKVQCTLVQALRLCTGRTAHRGSRGIALTFLEHDTRRGWGVSVTPRPLFTSGKDPVPIVQEAGLDMCGKISPPPGFDPPTVQPVVSRYTDYCTRHVTSWIAKRKWFCL